ncbi:autotransporter-associated beta strand repeat-containing protein, partial [Enhydrobacter aerosaccus]
MGSRTSGVLALIAVLIVALATDPALAQSWNFYSSLGQSTTLNFNTAMSANQDATLNVKVGNTNLGSIPMDTGSNGILSSAFVPTAGDTYLGPGTETLTSSKITYNGNLYQTTVTIGSGANTVTSKVTVLQVTSITSAACPQGCAPGTVAYMGVGFNRGVSTVTALTPGTLINTNPFINVTAINGTAVTNLQQGYIISSTGITLGLNSTNTQNYAFVKLMPDTSPSPSSQAGTVWQQAPATVVVNGVAGSGTILPDSGIGYSYLTPPKYVGQTPCPTPPGGACLPSSATVMIYLPGQTTPQLAMYSLTDPGSPLSPAWIAINPPSSTTFVNTGRLFYLGFDYLYDPASGFVGYASVDPTYASVTPMVALIGTVDLADNFSSTYPTYLFGPTTLLEAGTGTISAVVSGSGGLTIGSGTVILQGVNTYLGGTTVTGGATLGIQADSGLGDASGGLTLNNGYLLLEGSFATARAITLGAGGGAILTNGNTLTVNQGISGTGGLLVSGSGQVVMAAANSYTGATMVNAGSTLALTGAGSIASSSGLTNNGTFDISGASSTVSLTSLAGNGAVNLGSRTLAITNGSGIFSGVIGGSGDLTVAGGFLGLTGNNTYTGMTNVTGGTLAVNGSIASTVTTAAGGTLTGSGQITGDVVNYGTFAPGNPYGTMTVNGDLAQTQGSTQYASVNSSGQVGNAVVTGTASLQGGTVSVAAAPGSYALSTTYRILRANGGLSGTYSSVTSSLPFLLPSLSYDANDAYVTLQIGGFQKAAQTATQMAVANALNASAQTATGDYASVMSAFSSLSTGQMSAVLNALSGQNYAAFSTSMTQAAQMFMNSFLSQAGGGSRTSGNVAGGGGSRVALAEACDVESACDTTTPAKWGAWGGGVGGVGSVGAGTGMGAVTYNLGGFAA